MYKRINSTAFIRYQLGDSQNHSNSVIILKHPATDIESEFHPDKTLAETRKINKGCS